MCQPRILGWIAILPFCLAVPGLAQYTQQGSKIIVTGNAGSPAAGSSVAISADGNTAAIGGPADNLGAGAVWFFTRSSGTWVQQGPKLVNGDTVGVAAQGTSVALSADGNTAVVGGINDNGGTGAMWAYTRSNGVWTAQGPRQWGTVLPPAGQDIHGPAGIAHQGVSIALSADGNTALVGGDLDSDIGAAWVFSRTNGVWGLVPFKLVGTSTAQAHQGSSVALSADGNTAILGGPTDSGGAGAAFVFVRSGNTWVQQGNKLTGFGATANAQFGSAVALSADGNTAIIGGSGDGNNSGSIWIFTRSNGGWSQQGNKLVGSDATSGRLLGKSISVTADGNTFLAGGPGGVPVGLGRTASIGAVWAFTRVNGAWSQQGSEFVGTGTAGGDALQGTAVAISGDGTQALVGGPTDNGGSGAVWAFSRPVPPSPPVITTQPGSGTVPSGQSATLTVAASGAAPLNYQWYQGTSGNTAIPVGANSPSYTTPVLIGATSYWVRVSNPYGTADSVTATLTLTAGGPVITQILTVANGSSTISPNTWIEIHGTNLSGAGDTRLWQAGDFVNSQLPLQLDTVTATVNGRSAYVEYISPTQVNALTPPDNLLGNVQVLVSRGGVNSVPFTVASQPIAPAFFVFQGQPYVAAAHTTGGYLAPASLFPGATPAKPGETIELFGSGFGPTVPPVTGGSSSQSGTLATAPVIIIGGIPAIVTFAGLVVPGEFQFNVIVPSGLPDGDNRVTAVYDGLSTQASLLITIQH